MFISSLIHWQSLGEISAFVRAKLVFVYFSFFDTEKQLAFFFGELQPWEPQNRNLYVKKYVTAQNLIEIRK